MDINLFMIMSATKFLLGFDCIVLIKIIFMTETLNLVVMQYLLTNLLLPGIVGNWLVSMFMILKCSESVVGSKLIV